MRKYLKQLFGDGTEYDSGSYCDFSAVAAKAVAGKDILLGVFNDDGTKLLAIAGQKSLSIKQSADTIEITSKDTDGGWKSYLPGMKEWSLDLDGIYVTSDESHKELSKAFNKNNPLCLKVYNVKQKKGMFGGIAVITEYDLDASYDDAMTYSASFSGQGKLTDLSVETPSTDTLPTSE